MRKMTLLIMSLLKCLYSTVKKKKNAIPLSVLTFRAHLKATTECEQSLGQTPLLRLAGFHFSPEMKRVHQQRVPTSEDICSRITKSAVA